MRSTWKTLLLATAGLVVAQAALAAPAPGKPRSRRGFSLFASTELPMAVNRLYCGINNLGQVCTALAGSPVAESGYWPKGTPDSYIFNSGLQLAGIIPINAGFAWAGDTIGVFFMDPRGDQAEGEGVTNVSNSLLPGDIANWPSGAVVRDTGLYNGVLIGLNNVSQEDLWVRLWDGNPVFTGSARGHPMGILVEERGMGWRYPTGNEDI